MSAMSAFVLGMGCMLLIFLIAAVVLSASAVDQDDDDDQWPGHRRGYGEF